MRGAIHAMLVAAANASLVACAPSGVCPDPADGADAAEAADATAASLEAAPPVSSYNVPAGPGTTIPLTGCAGPGYAATFTVGTQAFELTLDTGSGTLAVASSSCTDCGVSPTYTPGPGAVDQHTSVSDSYLMGTWQGDAVTDTVQLAGTGAVTMNIAQITSQTGFFGGPGCGLGASPFAPQGIAGLGPRDLAQPGTDAFVTKWMAMASSANVLGFEMCAAGGQMFLGGIDAAAAGLAGPAVYTPMTKSQYYSVALDDVQLGGTSLGFGPTDYGVAAVDTGTSVLALPAPAFEALASDVEGLPEFAQAFPGHGSFLGSTTCASTSFTAAEIDAMLPSLTLVFPADGGTGSVTLAPTASYLSATTSNGATFFCTGVVSNPASSGTILGTSILRSQLAIFDLDSNLVGFAPQTFCK